MKKQLSVLLMIFMCCGCSQIRDAVIRGIHMDYGYYGEVFPRIMEGYERKMEQPPLSREPAIPAPDSMNQG